MKLLLLLTELKGMGLWGSGVIVPVDLLWVRFGVDWCGCMEDGGVEEP